MKTLFENVSKSDARKLISWWNANTRHYHFKQKSGRLWNVMRQT